MFRPLQPFVKACTDRHIAHADDGTDSTITTPGRAQLLRVEPRYVYRLVNERRIPHLKLGHYLRFDATEIDGWLRASQRPVTPHAKAVYLPVGDAAPRP